MLAGHDDLVKDCLRIVKALLKHTVYEDWVVRVEPHRLKKEKWADVEWSVPARRIFVRISPGIEKASVRCVLNMQEILAHEVAHAIMDLQKSDEEEKLDKAADAVGLALLGKTRAMGDLG